MASAGNRDRVESGRCLPEQSVRQPSVGACMEFHGPIFL